MWNTAILFKTSDILYHGLPEPIKCPDNKYRKSIAIYYVSKPRENLIERYTEIERENRILLEKMTNIL